MFVADRLFYLLDEHIEHNGLRMFTSRYVTFGLLGITNMLASGIEIFSWP